MAARLQSCLRGYDSIGRYGDEEFLILMPGCDPVHNSGRLKDLLMSIHGRPFVVSEQGLALTCSFGVTAERPEQTANSEEDLLNSADQALYEAKRRGRNRVVRRETTGTLVAHFGI